MKFGHHGANHPVADWKVPCSHHESNPALQWRNHIGDNVKTTHRSLFDGSLQGIKRTDCVSLAFKAIPSESRSADIGSLFTQLSLRWKRG